MRFLQTQKLSFFTERIRGLEVAAFTMQWEPAVGTSERNGAAHQPACLWGAVSQFISVLVNHTDTVRDNPVCLLGARARNAECRPLSFSLPIRH